MTSIEWALHAAIAAAPKDESPRLIFSDWLMEQGREIEALAMRSNPTTAGVPKWRWGYRHSWYGGDGGDGGHGGYGGYGGSGGDGG